MKNLRKLNFDNVLPKTIKQNIFNTKKIRIKNHNEILRTGNTQGIIESGKNIVFFFFLLNNLIFLIIIFNLVNNLDIKQVINNKEIQVVNKPLRGKILDRNEEIISASILMQDLYIDPKRIIDEKLTRKRLQLIFPKKNKVFFEKVFEKNEYKLVKKYLSKDDEYEIKKIGEPGLIFQNSIKRVYPQNHLFSQVTGFMSRHGEPQSKLERNLNKTLSNGNDVKLTLDMRVQNIVYEQIKIGMKKYNSKAAASVLLDVDNGEIISMISLPDFNPNHPSLIRPFTENNLITTSRFEMGSTLKIFNAAMAYENNSVDENELFDVSNNYQLTKKHIIKDDFPSKSPINFDTIFTKSSNIGSIQILEKVGIDKQKNFLENLGLKKNVRIKGLFTIQNSYPKNWNNEISKSISFGYGISLTPISLTKLFSSLVNGGFEVHPTLILRANKIKRKRVIDERTSKKINELLNKIVLEGTGKKAKVNSLSVGGKTGTAKKIFDGNYDDQKLVTSFIGTFPIEKPKYLLFVIFDEPKKENKKNDYYGGNTAAPVFSNIVSQIAPILQIKPKREKNIEDVVFKQTVDN